MPHKHLPTASLVVREQGGRVYYEAKFRDDIQQVMRRIGPAWLEAGPDGEWRTRRGRVPDGYFDERPAHARASELVASYLTAKPKKGRRVVTFRDLAADYMRWLATDYGAKPTTRLARPTGMPTLRPLLHHRRSRKGDRLVPYERRLAKRDACANADAGAGDVIQIVGVPLAATADNR